MYEKYFYLKESSFHITPDPRFLYLGTSTGGYRAPCIPASTARKVL